MGDYPFSVLTESQALSYFPDENSVFYTPVEDDVPHLKETLLGLPDDSTLPLRGRDWADFNFNYKEWEYGYAVKRDTKLYFLYENGESEIFEIDHINYVELVHFALLQDDDNHQAIPIDQDHVIILSHGWSENLGPNYPLIRTLEAISLKKGWKTIVPDFRQSYRYGSERGRSERVRIIYEEIICLDPKPSTLVLVGHSQGGAASSHSCTPRVVQSSNIKGLLLLGSENPRALDGMNWKPPVENLQIIHAEGDSIITVGENEELARVWDVPFHCLTSIVGSGKRDSTGDDIHHDFMVKDLLSQMVHLYEIFLDQCRNL